MDFEETPFGTKIIGLTEAINSVANDSVKVKLLKSSVRELEAQLEAEQKSVNELSLANQELHERIKVLEEELSRVTAYYEGCMEGVKTDNYQDVLDQAKAAMGVKE